jgi:hypothetical protein
MNKSGQPEDPVRAAADLLRKAKSGLPQAEAKLELQENSRYVEYFRGKDLARYIEAHPGALNERAGAARGQHAERSCGAVQYLRPWLRGEMLAMVV